MANPQIPGDRFFRASRWRTSFGSGLLGSCGQARAEDCFGPQNRTAISPTVIKGGSIVKTGLGVVVLSLAAGVMFSITDSQAVDKPAAVAWRAEQWTGENFTCALGGGPGWGPVEQCGGSAYSVCGDKAGNMYIVNGQSVDIVTKKGIRYRLAGTGEAGYRDGAAETAQFKIGINAYYGANNIQVDGRGNVFVSDSGNGCVRRIFKNAKGQWTVETWAGGGKKKLKVGEKCPAREIQLHGTMMVAAAQGGQVTIATQFGGCFQVSPDGKTITFRGPWPSHKDQKHAEKGLFPPWQGGDSDRVGNAYFVSRTPDLIYKVTSDGMMAHIGINPAVRGKKAGDGPPFEIYFDTPDSGCCDPSGLAVYVCGGDEYDIRRVPTDLTSTSATLMKNGRWYVMTVDPKPSGGTGEIDPGLVGKPSNEGGPLTVLVNCHLAGRDFEGNLYGWQYGWCGRTLTVKGKGLLGTKVYRFRRVK